MSVFRKRGFDAHKKEESRRKEESKKRQGNLWRFFLKDDEEDVPLRFLTEDPILFYEHSLKTPDGKYDNATCLGDDCEHCARGDKPSYKGAWLVADGREIEVDERKNGTKTGKKKIVKDQVKLYVRGATDIAKLDRQSKKFGLVSRPWFATKTGQNTSTSYELDRGEEDELSPKELANLIAKLPEKYREHYTGDEEELYDIVEDQIFGDVIEDDEEEEEDEKPAKGRAKKSLSKGKKSRRDEDEDEDEDDEDLDSGVQSLDDDEDEDEDDEVPARKPIKKKSVAPKKSSSSKPAGKKLFKRR